jgi:hypothetical protein
VWETPASHKVATERIWKKIQSLGGEAIAPKREAAAETVAAESVAQPPQPDPTPESATFPAISEPSVPSADRHPDSEPAPSQATRPSAPPVAAAPIDEPVATVGAQAANVAPVKGKAIKKASRTKKSRVGDTNASVQREGSKTSQVIAMLKREGGATLEEIMTTMGWQQHTTRALMSAGGSLAKKHGLVVASEKVGDQRTYFIKG